MAGPRDQQLESMAEDLFQRAADLPTWERERFLWESDAPEAVKARVAALLDALGSDDHAEGRRAVSLDDPVWAPSGADADPADIGPRFRIIRTLGEGGFGTVYLAEQIEPITRLVAVKVIKPGMDTRQVLARFRAERQALAMMEHPCIARVFEAGATAGGRPYFVMEYIAGEPLLRYCDSALLDTRARLTLFVSVCEGVAHAHQRGIIHRDLKPSNVLVARAESADAPPVPKIIDFGIAKATGPRRAQDTLATEANALIGTPLYMSPEQIAGSADIDTRADVYSLGIVLYEMLCGTSPFQISAPESPSVDVQEALRRTIRDVDPQRPSTRLHSMGGRSAHVAGLRRTDPDRLRRMLRDDLDWIVMKAIEKDRARRYESVGALAEDIRRHLTDRPVSAGPPGTWYRASKAIRRNRGLVAAALVVTVSAVIALGATFAGYIRASRERDRADEARVEEAEQRRRADERASEAEAQLYVSALSAAHSALDQANAVTLWRSLDMAPQALRGWEWEHLAHRAWPGAVELTWTAHAAEARCEPIGGTGLAFAVRESTPGSVTVWDPASGTVRWTSPCAGAALAVDGRSAVLVLPDGSLVRVDPLTGAAEWTVPPPEEGRWRLTRNAFSLDSSVFAVWTGDRHRFQIRSASSGRLEREIRVATPLQTGPQFVDLGDGRPASAVYFHATRPGESGGQAVILDIESGTEPTDRAWLTLLPDRRRTVDRRVLRDHVSGAEYYCPEMELDAEARAIVVSPDGRTIATGDNHGVVALWDWLGASQPPVLRRRIPVSPSQIVGVAFDPRGSTLLATGLSGVRVVPVHGVTEPLRTGPAHWRDSAVFSPDGLRLARCQWGTVSVVDAELGAPLWRRNIGRGVYGAVAWSPDGSRVAVASTAPPEFFVIDAATGEVEVAMARGAVAPDERWPNEPPYRDFDRLADMAFSPDGSRLLLAATGGGITVIDAANWVEVPGRSVAGASGDAAPSGTSFIRFSPDGSLLAHGFAPGGDQGSRGIVVLRDSDTLEQRAVIDTGMDAVAAGWSADSSRIAIGGAEGAVEAWHTAGPERFWTCAERTGQRVNDLCWSPDGRRLCASFGNGEIGVLHGSSGRRLMTMGVAGGEARAAWLDRGATFGVAVSYGHLYRFESGASVHRRGPNLEGIWPEEAGAPADWPLARSRARAALSLIDSTQFAAWSSDRRLEQINRSDAAPEVKKLASAWLRRMGVNINYANSMCISVARDEGSSLADRVGAVELLEECVRLKPHAASLHANLGWLCYRAGRYEAALAALDRHRGLLRIEGEAPGPEQELLENMCRWSLGDCDGTIERSIDAMAEIDAGERSGSLDTRAMLRDAGRLFGLGVYQALAR